MAGSHRFLRDLCISLRCRLMVLMAVSLVPVVLVTAVGMVLLARSERRSIEQSMMQATRAITSAVDSELANSIRLLQQLATAGSLQSADLAAFHESAIRVIGAHPEWTSVNLAAPSGRMLLDSNFRFGEALTPAPIETRSFEATVRTGKPQVSGLVTGPRGRMRYVVRVPVTVGGELRYVLSAAVQPDTILSVIERQRLEPEITVAVFDSARTIVARSRRHSEFVGKPISEDLRRFVESAQEGWRKGVTLEGFVVYNAFSQSAMSGWGVGMGIPREVLDAPLRRSYFALLAGLVLSLLLGGFAALLMARQIVVAMQGLGKAAAALGEGRQMPPPVTAIPEIREVAQTLARAGDARLKAEATRDAALAEAHDANARKDELLAMLTSSNAELQRLAYVASHDLQSPLRSVTNFAELLERRLAGKLADDEQDWLRRVVQGGRRMQQLVADLLSYARIDSQSAPPVPVDLNDTLRGTLDLLHGVIEDSGARVSSDPLPTVMGHALHLQQLFLNLISNAIHYRSDAPPEIHISALREDSRHVISVQDNGIGIDPRHHEEIFDVFRRVDGQRPGSGIGLAICRRVVERMCGRIWVESSLGKGSTFRFSVPAA